MLHIISAVTHLEPVFPVVPPVQPSSLAKMFPLMVSFPSCRMGKSWETRKKPMVRILLAVPAPIGTREALGAARLNLVQKGLALKS